MQRYFDKNEQLIEAAFAKIAMEEQKQAEKAMVKALEKALGYIQDIHKSAKHNFHLNVEGGHAWVLLHDGSEIRRYVSAGKVQSPNAATMVEKAIEKASKKGWVGIVMADMDSEVYQVNFERGVLTSAMNQSGGILAEQLEKMKLK